MKTILFLFSIIISFIGVFIKIYKRDYAHLGDVFLIMSVISFYYFVYLLIFKRNTNN